MYVPAEYVYLAIPTPKGPPKLAGGGGGAGIYVTRHRANNNPSPSNPRCVCSCIYLISHLQNTTLSIKSEHTPPTSRVLTTISIIFIINITTSVT